MDHIGKFLKYYFLTDIHYDIKYQIYYYLYFHKK